MHVCYSEVCANDADLYRFYLETVKYAVAYGAGSQWGTGVQGLDTGRVQGDFGVQHGPCDHGLLRTLRSAGEVVVCGACGALGCSNACSGSACSRRERGDVDEVEVSSRCRQSNEDSLHDSGHRCVTASSGIGRKLSLAGSRESFDGVKMVNSLDEVKDGTVSSAADGQSCGKVDGFGSSPVADTRTVNQAKRDKNKQRKARKKAGTSGGGGGDVPEWRRGSGVLGRNGKPRDPDAVGFWKSCSVATRKELIESKAAMHIAENKRKAREAEARFDYLNSPQATVNHAVKLAERAKVYGAQAAESMVHGYAQTVSTSSAESLVRSLPDSCTSYSDYAQRKVESEYSEKLNEVCKSNEDLEKQVGSLQRQLAESLVVKDRDQLAQGTGFKSSDVELLRRSNLQLTEKVEELEAARLFAMKSAKFKGPSRCESLTTQYPYGGGKLGNGYSQWD